MDSIHVVKMFTAIVPDRHIDNAAPCGVEEEVRDESRQPGPGVERAVNVGQRERGEESKPVREVSADISDELVDGPGHPAGVRVVAKVDL